MCCCVLLCVVLSCNMAGTKSTGEASASKKQAPTFLLTLQPTILSGNLAIKPEGSFSNGVDRAPTEGLEVRKAKSQNITTPPCSLWQEHHCLHTAGHRQSLRSLLHSGVVGRHHRGSQTCFLLSDGPALHLQWSTQQGCWKAFSLQVWRENFNPLLRLASLYLGDIQNLLCQA